MDALFVLTIPNDLRFSLRPETTYDLTETILIGDEVGERCAVQDDGAILLHKGAEQSPAAVVLLLRLKSLIQTTKISSPRRFGCALLRIVDFPPLGSRLADVGKRFALGDLRLAVGLVRFVTVISANDASVMLTHNDRGRCLTRLPRCSFKDRRERHLHAHCGMNFKSDTIAEMFLTCSLHIA